MTSYGKLKRAVNEIDDSNGESTFDLYKIIRPFMSWPFISLDLITSQSRLESSVPKKSGRPKQGQLQPAPQCWDRNSSADRTPGKR